MALQEFFREITRVLYWSWGRTDGRTTEGDLNAMNSVDKYPATSNLSPRDRRRCLLAIKHRQPLAPRYVAWSGLAWPVAYSFIYKLNISTTNWTAPFLPTFPINSIKSLIENHLPPQLTIIAHIQIPSWTQTTSRRFDRGGGEVWGTPIRAKGMLPRGRHSARNKRQLLLL